MTGARLRAGDRAATSTSRARRPAGAPARRVAGSRSPSAARWAGSRARRSAGPASRSALRSQPRLGGLGQLGEVARRAPAGRRPPRRPRRAVPRRTPGSSPASGTRPRRRDHARLVDQPGQRRQHVSAAHRPPGRVRPARARRVERGAAGEHRQPPAPASAPRSSSRSQLHSTTARSVWWRGSAVRLPPVSSRNRSSEPGGDLLGGQRAQPGGGQLDGQRHAVERAGRSRRPAPASAPTAKPGRTAAARSAKQPHGRIAGGVGRVGAGRWQAERRTAHRCLAGDAERLPAGGQDPDVRAVGRAAGRRARRPASTRCSQLSSTISSRLPRSALTRRSNGSRGREASGSGRPSRSPSALEHGSAPALSRRSPGPARPATPRRAWSRPRPPRPPRPAGSCPRRPGPISVTSRCADSSSAVRSTRPPVRRSWSAAPANSPAARPPTTPPPTPGRRAGRSREPHAGRS